MRGPGPDVMATLLSILLVIVPNCLASAPPAPPSLPQCYIRCGEENDCVDIHCSWDPKPDPETNYSLHWEPAISEEGNVINGTSSDGIIQRKHFKHGELRVWVQAKNQHGSATSQDARFNTADIIQLLPPKLLLVTHEESLEISWNSTCDEQQFSWGHCDVQYRIEGDQVWLQDMDIFHGSYTVDSPQPGTVYEFQVRCSCHTGLTSDWSAIYRIRSTETAPDGDLDVWGDCGISHTISDCVVTWKKLPVSQAHGLILGYKVRLSYNNNASEMLTVTPVQPLGRVACEKMQCPFTFPLKDAASVSVSAYNTHGATVPSYLAMPIPGKEKNEQAIRLVMTEEKLTVSWDLPSQLSDHLQEYVVQCKQAGRPPGHGFDWIKVNKSQTTGIFEGQYRKYTPYQVSLFTVSDSSEVRHLSSAIGYSLQGTPSTVPSFKVFYIAPTDVTLFWKSTPLAKQNGVILYYQIIVESGANPQKVYNASVSPQRDNETFQLLHLSPGQEYEVRIRAVTAAGPGANETAKFKTKHHEHFGHLVAVVLGINLLVVTCVALVLYSAFRAPCFLYKVPNARNSHIFRHMKHMNGSLSWICIPVYEPNPQISVLEVVEIQPWALSSSLEKTSDPDRFTRPVVGDGGSKTDCRDDQRKEAVAEEGHGTNHRYGREEYSKMVDFDEERNRGENGEDVWSSSEEEQPESGYEKHFMPTAFEVLEV
ncbi:interleukin 12 receptor, beta 2a, like isoform X2 [Pseudoliparis swirei]|uniref:interleukin 12 receptor, beta 2a, like isoform X2 n=2 Tax=Pseudoliparis swirei TaxID=2059687 RepID=UPI0024BD6068|nr:interleukin 12 receptor, beta 2a, like isoform X2 [Pseudoliparis swirei]